VTHHPFLSKVMYDACSTPICINQHTKFEMRSFTDSKHMIGAKFKKTGHMTLTTPISE